MKKTVLVLIIFSILIFTGCNRLDDKLTESNEETKLDSELINILEKPIEANGENFEGVLIMEDSVGTSGRFWNQDEAYDTYRIRVNNTSNQIMKVTVSSSLGGTWVFEVPPNDSSTWAVKNAVSSEHYVAFITPNGIVSGTIDVAVSGEDS